MVLDNSQETRVLGGPEQKGNVNLAQQWTDWHSTSEAGPGQTKTGPAFTAFIETTELTA